MKPFLSLRLLLLLTMGIPAMAAEKWSTLVSKLENTSEAKLCIFQLRDDKGHGMDCLDIFQSSSTPETDYFGVSHSLKKGVFSVHLTHSTDFKNWTHLAELDQHASQATVHETENGSFLLAYEKDAPNSCWIRIRHYQNLETLKTGRHSREIDIPRTLAPTAEGTPSFEKVILKGGSLDHSRITLRFHYFENARVDQLASGTLTNFKSWKAYPSKKINTALKKLGGLGNLGDRSKFTWQKKTYYLQEVQTTRLDWGSWGIHLCDQNGQPLKKIRVKTTGKSTAFSNPSVAVVHDANQKPLFVFSAFLHSKGTAPGEAGQMLTVFEAN